VDTETLDLETTILTDPSRKGLQHTCRSRYIFPSVKKMVNHKWGFSAYQSVIRYLAAQEIAYLPSMVKDTINAGLCKRIMSIDTGIMNQDLDAKPYYYYGIKLREIVTNVFTFYGW
jgi:hypothetical protein